MASFDLRLLTFLLIAKVQLSLTLTKKARFFSSLLIKYLQKFYYSTVTDFAKFLGWSTLHPLITAIW